MPEGDVLVLIPARIASSRLPGKALAEIAGKPMIVHMLALAKAAAVGPVAVATDSREVADVVEAAGIRAVMTREEHASGSDRIHEALGAVDPAHRAALGREARAAAERAFDRSRLGRELLSVYESVAVRA